MKYIRSKMKLCFLLVAVICHSVCSGQTLGGNSLFTFLKLPNGPHLTALGGINISSQSNDVSLGFQNPALLKASMDQQLHVAFNSLYAGINQYHISGAIHHQQLKTVFGAGITYMGYGDVAQTDASGNEMGNFRPYDYVIQASASRQYLKHWSYGATIKYIHSGYGQYQSSALAFDAAILFADTTNQLQASLVFKNMGTQLTIYDGSQPDDLPFDVQLGISKRLQNAPIQFSLTAHHLHRFNLLYNDSSVDGTSGESALSFNNIFSHLVFSTQLYLSERLEVTAAYNHLRRKELEIGRSGNGLNGFSLGIGILFKKIQMRYAKTYFQPSVSSNHFGLNINIRDYFRN